MVSVWNYGCSDHQSTYLRLIVSNPQQGEETVVVNNVKDAQDFTWRTFLTQDPNITTNSYWNKKSTFVFNASSVTVILAGVWLEPQIMAFQLYYSFHHEDRVPYRTDKSSTTIAYTFNCSVDYFASFRKHLDCSGSTECEGGEDEGDHCYACQFTDHAYSGRCPFCPGGVASPRNGKCYIFEKVTNVHAAQDFNEFLSLARETCRLKGGRVAFPKDPLDLATLQLSKPSKNDHCFNDLQWQSIVKTSAGYFIGMIYGGLSTPNLYRQMWHGADRSVSHGLYEYINRNQLFAQHIGRVSCAMAFQSNTSMMYGIYSPCVVHQSVVCEFILQPPKKEEIELLAIPLSSSLFPGGLVLLFCPQRHLAHAFLRCDTRALCGQLQPTPSCFLSNTTESLSAGKTHEASENQYSTTSSATRFSSPGLVLQFACGDGKTYIPYTLVCDFRPDCKDHSDEVFCRHPPCINAFTCLSGQCVSYVNCGNLISDCFDDSDEIMDEPYSTYEFKPTFEDSGVTLPYIIQYNAQGYFTKEELGSEDSCPDTHYRCPGPLTICMPVYTRCNGWFDCEGRQDEDGCDSYQCPGFYRCLDSQVCVHPDHLCDGWPQCPQRDDEWLCEENPCPDGCMCQGLAFVCVLPFPSHLHPQLRYLDGSGSGISPASLNFNIYLIHLVLSQCQLIENDLVQMNNANLKFLDLSKNLIEAVNTSVFLQLSNLQTILMSGNPLTTIHSGEPAMQQISLQTLDLSNTKLSTFSSKPWEAFPVITTLNLSFTPLKEFTIEGLKQLTFLEELDVTSNPLQYFQTDVFLGLSRLKTVNADNYKLCCSAVLPSHMDQHSCHAKEDEVSSCDDLLRSGLYRVFSWLICCLSVTGNIFCLVFRSCVQRTAGKSAFNLFVSSLCVADLLMGIYTAMIGAADAVSRGQYIIFERDWVTSKACKAAGFFSLLSCEVSALTILLITLDRFIVLRFPFSTMRINKTSAAVTCVVTWVIGLTLAVVPLLPVTSHWEFYSQSGICIPLPVTRRKFEGQAYSTGIIILLNFILFILIVAGQGFVYWSVQQNAMSTNTTRKSHDLTVARRLITVALTDFLCWFPIGFCGILAWSGVAIPGEVSVALAMLVLPINAALNPFLYTFNIIMEKRRKARMEKMVIRIKSALAD